ncbi:hypothetical protein AOCH_006812 [Aspergillus ochraceoroseus]|uniref:Uncharacterized protein n=1 Tax=Aspergillus ochraceoroseus TaxID=138278 RepID=A0A0F8UYH1_9EURO|nr:hypothetical protein AOCH_006812 [Aspergillus ochraceoroseus]
MFNPNNAAPWHYNQNPIVIDSESDENEEEEEEEEEEEDEADSMQVETHTARTSSNVERTLTGYNGDVGPSLDRLGPPLSAYHTSIEQEKKVRCRLREERHAALCVLMDREILTIQALAAQETIPQARRRFLAKLMAPEDPDVAASIRADQFTIQRPSSSLSSSALYHNIKLEHMNVSKVVSRAIVDVCETDDTGWYRPDADTGPSSAAGSPGLSSPASASKVKGKLTPDRARANRRVSSGRQQRDRRRRWSGAERQDHGVSLQGLPS